MKIKKLIVLTGDPKNDVAKEILRLKAATPAPLFKDVIEVLASLSGQTEDKFTDPRKSVRPFGKDITFDVTTQVLKRFTSRLGLGAVPVTLAGAKLKTPKEAVEFFDSLANKRWGRNWVANIFYNEFAFIKEGIFLMTDADDYLDALRNVIKDNSMIIVRIDPSQVDEMVFDQTSKTRVELIMRRTKEEKDGSQYAIKLLQTLKELLKKR